MCIVELPLTIVDYPSNGACLPGQADQPEHDIGDVSQLESLRDHAFATGSKVKKKQSSVSSGQGLCDCSGEQRGGVRQVCDLRPCEARKEVREVLPVQSGSDVPVLAEYTVNTEIRGSQEFFGLAR